MDQKMDSKDSITRRGFLSAGAAAVAGAATLNARADGFRFSAMNRPLRVAVAGCGARGMLLLSELRALAAEGVAVRVAAVADEDSKRRADAARLGGAVALADWRECAVRDDVDALVVALPDDLHAAAALAALARGRHVYLETPVARSADEAEALVRAARDSGATVQVGAARCALPAWQVAARLVQEGRIGRAHWCHSVASCDAQGGAGGWRAQRGRSQGPAAQQHYDQVMPLLAALNPGPAVSASTAGGRWNGVGGTADSLMSTIGFADGLTVNLVSSGVNTAGQHPVLRGEKGCIEVRPDGVLCTPESGTEQWIAAPANGAAAERVLLGNWIDAITGRCAPLCPLTLGLAAQRAVDLAVAAWQA